MSTKEDDEEKAESNYRRRMKDPGDYSVVKGPGWEDDEQDDKADKGLIEKALRDLD